MRNYYKMDLRDADIIIILEGIDARMVLLLEVVGNSFMNCLVCCNKRVQGGGDCLIWGIPKLSIYVMC